MAIPILPSEGNYQWVVKATSKRCHDELMIIEQRMLNLRAATRVIQGRAFGLVIQRRDDRDSMTLRWRDAKGSMIADSDFVNQIADYPVSLREWYASVHVQVLWLNVAERTIRRVAHDYSGLSTAIALIDAAMLSDRNDVMTT